MVEATALPMFSNPVGKLGRGEQHFLKTLGRGRGEGEGTIWEDTKTWNFQSCFSDRMHDFFVIIPRCYKILKILAQLDSRILCL